MGELSKPQVLTEGEKPLTSLYQHSFSALNLWAEKRHLIAPMIYGRNQQRGSSWVQAQPADRKF